MENLENFVIDKDYLCNVINNNNYNKIIYSYYEKFYSDSLVNINSSKVGRTSLLFKLERLKNCNKRFNIDVYEQHKVKDFLSTNLCHDKFCSNCKKVRQASRMAKYIPFMESYSDSMYHLTLTIPNVCSSKLKDSLNNMSYCFKQLLNILRGTRKISWLNLPDYSYLGAVRSLEITFSEDSYHPHYHVAIILKNLSLEKNLINVFSYDFKKGREVNYFSSFEIIIQKIWYMLFNNIRLTEENFNNLDNGYACVLKKFCENDYAELFKYLCKETKEDSSIMSYDNFVALYSSTFNIKQIQGYGCLYRINDLDIDSVVDEFYVDILNFLSDEHPINKLIHVNDLLYDNDFTLISRKKIYQYLRDLNSND